MSWSGEGLFGLQLKRLRPLYYQKNTKQRPDLLP